MAAPPSPVRARYFVQTSTYLGDTGVYTEAIAVNTESNVTTAVASGSGVKGWRQKIARKVSASSAYTRVAYQNFSNGKHDSTYRTKTTKGNYNVFRRWGTGATGLLAATSLTSLDSSNRFVSDQAVSRIKSKLNDLAGEFSSMLPLAELNETRSLIRSTASTSESLIHELVKIRKGRGSVKSLHRAASDAWLNFSFGISPTIADINQLVDTVGKAITAIDEVVAVSGHSSTSLNTKGSDVGILGAGGNFVVHPVQFHNFSCKYTGGFRISNVKGANNYSLPDRFGLEFQDLPELGWELIPYSWIVDYFSTTGAYFSDVFHAPPGTLVYLVKTLRSSGTSSTTGYFNPTVAGATGSFTGSSMNFVQVNRSLATSLPHAQLRFKTVDEIGGHAVNKLLNLASVLKFK